MKKYTNSLASASVVALIGFGLCPTVHSQSLSTVTDMYDSTLPGSAFGWVQRATHLLTPGETVSFDQMEAIDWIIPNSTSAFGPGVFDRKLTDSSRIDALPPSGFSMSGAHHQYDSAIVPFTYSDGELTLESPPEGYWATSWIGDDPGGNAVWEFRVEVGADSLEVWHWWNHGLGDTQTLTATLFNAAGSSLVSEVVYEHNTTAFSQYTSIINVTGTTEGDYMIIEHKGTNVGWRGSAVLASEGVGPVDPDYGQFDSYDITDGFAMTGDWLGDVWVRDTFPFVKIDSLGTWAYSVGDWLHIDSFEGTTMVMIDEGDNGWAYFFDVSNFGYKHGSWVYFVR